MRVIADHARAAAFLIADGVFPDKTGREYVLRRIMRRAVRHGWRLGIEEPFLHRGRRPTSIDEMGGVYPELRERASLIAKITARGGDALPRDARARRAHPRRARRGKLARQGRSPATLAFKLYDTYGFPLDLTRVIAEQRGLDVDEAGFETRDGRAAQAQRVRGLGRGRGRGRVPDRSPSASARRKFLGYETTAAQAKIVALVADGKEVERRRPVREATSRSIAAETPFYGEQGGQIGDTGTVARPQGAPRACATRKRPVSTLCVHLGEVEPGRAARRRHRRARPSTTSAATPSAATTRRRTSCTGRCARCSASTSRRRARWSRPIACASTSRTSRR